MAKQFDDFEEAFRQLNKEQMDKLFNNLDELASRFFQDDQYNVPEVSGQLKKSRKHNKVRLSETSMALELSYNTPYARKVYFVTAKSGQLRWMEVTYSQHKKEYEALILKLAQ